MKGYKCVRTACLRRENWFWFWSSSQGPLLDVKHCRDVTSFSDCLKLNVGDKEARGPPFLEPPFAHFKRPPPPSLPPPPLPSSLFATSPLLLSPSQVSLSPISSFFFSICFLSSFSSSSSPSPTTYLTANITKRFSIVLNSIWNLGGKRGGEKKKKKRTFNGMIDRAKQLLGRFFASFVICPIIHSYLCFAIIEQNHPLPPIQLIRIRSEILITISISISIKRSRTVDVMIF